MRMIGQDQKDVMNILFTKDGFVNKFRLFCSFLYLKIFKWNLLGGQSQDKQFKLKLLQMMTLSLMKILET